MKGKNEKKKMNYYRRDEILLPANQQRLIESSSESII